MPTKLEIWDQRMIMLMHHCVQNEIEPTQGAFLKSIGMHEQSLSQIESGKASFRAKHILTAAKKYSIDVNWVFGLSNTMKRSPAKSALQNLKDAVKAIEVEFKT